MLISLEIIFADRYDGEELKTNKIVGVYRMDIRQQAHDYNMPTPLISL